MIKPFIAIALLIALVGCDTPPRQVLPYIKATEAGGTDLYLYDLENGNSRPLLQTPGHDEYDPSIDPAGSKIVYLARKISDSLESRLYTISVYDLETGLDKSYHQGTTRLSRPVWSNDGTSIAYVVESDGKLEIAVWNLADQSDPKTIGSGSDPSWRVDDKALYYNARDTADAPAGDLMVHDLKTGLNQSLGLRGNDFRNLPRGTSIVYTSLPYTRRNQAVWLIDVNARQQRLSNPGKSHRDAEPVHVPGSTFVAFTRTDTQTQRSAIYVVQRDAPKPVETLLFQADTDTYTLSGPPKTP